LPLTPKNAFILQPRTPKALQLQYFDFLKKMRLEKNRENFDIFQSHNMLSARCLQKTVETSIYKNAEIGKASAVAAAMDWRKANVKPAESKSGSSSQSGNQ
jgi:hypothetical protein